MAKRNKDRFQELSPSDKRALQLMTPEGRTELFGDKKTEEPKPAAGPLVPDSPLKTFGQELAEGMYASNIAQQEPARQASEMRDAERAAKFPPLEPAAVEEYTPVLNEMNLTAAGQAEYDAAARGEIPGYDIQDPGARAAFSRAVQQDPSLGRRPVPEDQRTAMPGGSSVVLESRGMDNRELSILEGRLEAAEARIRDATSKGRKPDPKDVELVSNISRVLRPVRSGRDPRDKPYRKQTDPARRGRGGGGGMVPGLTPAYSSGREIPLSRQDPTLGGKDSYQTMGGLIIPGEGLSEAAFGEVIASNPIVGNYIVDEARSLGVLTNTEEEELRSLDAAPPRLRADQRDEYYRNVGIRRARVMQGLAGKVREQDQVERDRAIRSERSAESQKDRDRKELETIYRRFLDPKTAGKVDALMQIIQGIENPQDVQAALDQAMTPEQYKQAEQFRDRQDAAYDEFRGNANAEAGNVETGMGSGPADTRTPETTAQTGLWDYKTIEKPGAENGAYNREVTGGTHNISGNVYPLLRMSGKTYLRVPYPFANIPMDPTEYNTAFAQYARDNYPESVLQSVDGIVSPKRNVRSEFWVDPEKGNQQDFVHGVLDLDPQGLPIDRAGSNALGSAETSLTNYYD